MPDSSTSPLWEKDLELEPVRRLLESKKHKVITTIARGGMGVVLQARDLRIRRTVAMKVMKTDHQITRENVMRFVDEAQLTGQLEHPNIVPVYELGIDEQGETYYTMKYVQGITLEEVLRGLRNGNEQIIAKYPLGTLLTIFQKICDAVAFAHSKGVVHRDLKPENVMIGAYGEVMVMDWGLAKNLADRRRDRVPLNPRDTTHGSLPGFQTLHGVIVGTPPYISPEQARGDLEKIDLRSDVYVLGALLYAMLTLRPPAVGKSVDEVVASILSGRIVAPSSFNAPGSARQMGQSFPENSAEEVALAHCPGGRIPEGLSAVATKAMQLDPELRYQSVEEMQADITAFQGGFAPKAERATLLRKMMLFAGRHKTEVALLAFGFVLTNIMLLGFVLKLNAEKNRAIASEARAVESERLAAERLTELRGTAPTFYADARSLMESQHFEDALEKINYAIAQVPNSAEYRYLRGNILQALFRFDDAVDAYEESLQRNEHHRGAKENLNLTKQIIASIGDDGRITPAVLRTLNNALLQQKRVAEALHVLAQSGRDKDLFFKTWKAAFEKRGLRQRFEATDNATLSVDLRRFTLPDLRKLRDAPITSLNLDDTRLPEITSLIGLPLEQLSLNRTLVRDLSPLAGMPLRILSLENTPVQSLSPLAELPLEILHVDGTRVEDLGPLRGRPLEQLYLSGCRNIRDLAPLAGLPLQTLDLSYTAVDDLRALIHSPVRELNLQGCVELSDLRPLLEMKSLESVLLPAHCKDVAFLRGHPSIKRLSYKKLTEPADEFWRRFDGSD